MLMNSVKRYIALRRQLGYGLLQADRLLTAYAQFAKCQGDTHIRSRLPWHGPPQRLPRAPGMFASTRSCCLLVSCTQKMQGMKSLRPTYSHLHRVD
jgi:hypothetical protein